MAHISFLCPLQLQVGSVTIYLYGKQIYRHFWPSENLFNFLKLTIYEIQLLKKILIQGYVFVFKRGRGEKERDIDMRKKHQLVASLGHLNQGLKPRYMP